MQQRVFRLSVVRRDCGSPMFAMSQSDLKDVYRCGTYRRRGLNGCTSHHIRMDKLLKIYVQKVKHNSAVMLEQRYSPAFALARMDFVTQLKNRYY